MIRTYCDGCGVELKGFEFRPGKLRIKIEEMAPGQRVVTIHVCNRPECIQQAVSKATAREMAVPR